MLHFVRMMFRPENIPLLLAAICSVLVFLIHLLVGISLERQVSLIVLLLGILAAGLLWERIVYLEQLMKVGGLARDQIIHRFYANRRHLNSFKAEISEAKHDIFIVGNVMGALVAGQNSVFEEKLKDGCKVRLLLMMPTVEEKPNPLIPYFARVTGNRQFPSLAQSLIPSLHNWRQSIFAEDRKAAGRLEIRFYSTLVTMTFLFLDPGGPSGKIRVELMPHEFQGNERPSFDLRPSCGEEGELFKSLVTKYNELWEKSDSLEKLMSPSRELGANLGSERT